MGTTVERALSMLTSSSDSERERGAGIAASLFDAAGGNAWPEPLCSHKPSDLDPTSLARLQEGLVEAARREPTSDSTGAAVWALGKRFDRSLRPFFLELLSANIGGNPYVLHQALVALGNLDEPSLQDASLSIGETQRNEELARAVLATALPQ